jgi:hypothetical protein
MAYLLTYGDLPVRARLCHVCENRLCVRPDHLYVGTRGETRHVAMLRSRDHVAVFWSNVRKSAACWEWTGLLLDGYGRFAPARGTDVRAHRFSWELAHGPIPPGKVICHNCPGGDNRKCVNPNHLFLGTQRENILDASRKHRLVNQQKTHCAQGHPLTGDNVRPRYDHNGRQCVTCARLAVQKTNRARRARGLR